MHSRWLLGLGILLMAAQFTVQAGERAEVKVLYDFEDMAEVEALKPGTENLELDIVQDNGVTSGKNCLRMVGKQGTDWAAMELGKDKLQGWSNFDYFVMDVYNDLPDQRIDFCFEVWDKGTKGYPTRCTFEDNKINPGKNTLVFQINRLVRNAKKEGRTWEELRPEDKIDMNNLTKVKMWITPRKSGGNTAIWVDKLRLMQEDAIALKVKLDLPASAKAYAFGKKAFATPGFTWMGAQGAGVKGQGLKEEGKGWPDPLTGTGLQGSGPIQFEAEVPEDGEYCVWVAATKLLGDDENVPKFPYPLFLKVGDKTLLDEKLSTQEYYGEKGLYRFMRTQWSPRQNSLWLDYVEPAVLTFKAKVKSEGKKIVVEANNQRLSAVIVMPAKDEAAFNKLADEIRQQRIKLFYQPLFFEKHAAPAKKEGDGAFIAWIPQPNATIRPWSAPKDTERAAQAVGLKAAAGERLVARVCITAFDDLGTGELKISDLTGAGTISAKDCRLYYQNYRQEDASVGEMALLPWTKIRFEAGTTWSYWLWWKVPDDAKPGEYSGMLSFKSEKGEKNIPIKLEVYPFKIEDTLPYSLGMYYGWQAFHFPEGSDVRKLVKEQHVFMREVGYTGTCVGCGNVTGLNGDHEVNVKFDPFLYEIAKEVGMGKIPEQQLMADTLGFGRAIGRQLRIPVDNEPGVECKDKRVKEYFVDAVKKFKAFNEKMGLPVAYQSVDEPRDVPNAWNRNIEQTNLYADWQHEAGVGPNFTTPMGDGSKERDNTWLVPHHDIVSVHAYEGSKRLIDKVRELKKSLWFYNTGQDRLSWGFYAWRMGAVGRWEWHFYFFEGGNDAYPSPADGFTSFTNKAGSAMPAPPYEFSGGMAFRTNFLTMAEGITDYAYLYTLEKAMAAAKADAGKAKAVEEAQAFLDALKKAIPEFPGVKGLADANAGALVGGGLDTPAAALTEQWRVKIGELLKKLK